MQIQIGPITYSVVEVPELAGAGPSSLCGDIDTQKCRIRINADMADAIKRVTLWHEIVHGILFAAGIMEHDEQVIDAIGHGLVQVLRDNPQLRGS
jgi:hypothetical protein